MPLAPGVRLGPYEIVAPLGAGGMGEVYRARDTRLLRDVAVKVLPQHLSSNPQLRSRFEREARAVSSLNHPHICTLHDVGRAGDTDYIVMELVEGETLEARLSRGRMATADLLRVAAQVASALDRAHRAGVVHRDLKPSNVMLTKAGAKLMDFGLAKGTGPGSPAALTAAPTATSPLTAEGVILGTYQYMAPEQLEGREADARTDLFALGLLIHEMATGRRAFDGRTQASLIAAILKDEPAPIGATVPMSPPALERLVALCLRKDPDERIQSAHDVRLRLEEIGEAGGASEHSVAGAAAGGAAGAAPARNAWGARIAWGIAALATVVGVGSAAALLSRKPPSAPLLVSSIPAPPGGSFVQTVMNLALAPDGRTIAFVSRGPAGTGLWIRKLAGTQATLVVASESAGCPFWSPDGRSLGFFSAGQLNKLDLATGQSDRLAPAEECLGAWWGADGSILYIPDRFAPIMRISKPGSQPEKIPIEGSEGSQRFYTQPSLLPDNRHILYTFNAQEGEGVESGFYVATIDGKDERRLLPFLSNARFVPSGHLIYGRDGALWAQRFDPDRLELEGEPIKLLDGVQFTGYFQTYAFAVSDNGLLSYAEGTGTLVRQLTWVDRKGDVVGTIGNPGNFYSPRLSRDGKHLAYDLSDLATESGDIWVFDLERGIPTRLTFDPRNESSPVWSPDDGRIAFHAYFPGQSDVVSIASDGRGNQEAVLSNGAFNAVNDWSGDGRSILVETRAKAWMAPADLQVVSLKGGETTPWLSTPFSEGQARFSPDGRWISYDSDESGRMEVYVRSFASPGGKSRVSSAGGSSSVWSRDGKELYYLSLDLVVMSVPVGPGPTFQGGTPVPLFRIPGDLPLGGSTSQYDASPDGRFVMNLNVRTQGQQALTLVSNWTALLDSR